MQPDNEISPVNRIKQEIYFFFEKLYGGETSPRTFYRKSKLTVSLD